MKPWNIHSLQSALEADLLACQTPFERAMCKTIGGKEIREFAENMSRYRKLTPGETAIAEKYGYRAA